MIQYVICDTDRLTAQDVTDRLPADAEVVDTVASLDMVGVAVPADAVSEDGDPKPYLRDAVERLPGGRFPRFPVMGRGEA